MKFDTDALVIGQFSPHNSSALASDSNIGSVGLLGNTCDRSRRHFRAHEELSKILEDTDEAVRRFDHSDSHLAAWLRGCPIVRKGCTPEGLRGFVGRFSFLVGTSFRGEHCNGGSYALSFTLARAMESLGFLRDDKLWTMFPFSEDRMIGLYCALAGFRSVDLSDKGRVFGTSAA
jgi:hypothetical protein